MVRISNVLVMTMVCVFSLTGWAQPAVEWNNTIGGTDQDYLTTVAVTADGGYIVAGYSLSGISGDKSEAGFGLDDYWVVKLNGDGNIEWETTIGASAVDRLTSIAQTDDDGYILAGYSNSAISGDKSEATMGNLDYWVVKLNSSGAIEWENTIAGSSIDRASSVIQTLDGGYLVGGTSNSGIAGDKTTAPFGNWDYWVVKLDASGTVTWDATYGSNTNDELRMMTLASDGGYLIGGQSDGAVSGNKTDPTNGGSDYWIIKIDDLGVIEWQNSIGGSGNDFFASLDMATDNGYFLGGSSISGVSGDKTDPNINANDYWIVKIDSLGAVQWDNNIGGDSYEVFGSLSATNDGGCIVGGDSNSGPWGGDKNSFSLGGQDYWVLKLNASGNIQWQRIFGGSGTDKLRIVAEGNNGEYIIAGYSNSNSNVTGNKSENSIGLNDFYVVKLEAPRPTAVILANPTSASCGQQVDFDGSGSIANAIGTSIVSYEWDFEDDGIYDATGALTSTTYSSTGTHTVRLRVTDDIGGVHSTTVVISVSDAIAPVPDVTSLPDILTECAVTSLSAPTATDNCLGTFSGTHNATLPITAQGTTVVTWTYDDGNGNSITQMQNVIIDDVSNPVAVNPTLSDIIQQCEVTTLTPPTASDNCAGIIAGTHNATLPITTQGTTVVTWTYDDGNGNSITQMQNVVINDNTAPLADSPSLLDITAACEVTALTAPTATDNCTGAIVGTHDATLPITTQGTTVVTWSYTDANGNISTQIQNVIIDDVTLPVHDVASLSNIVANCEVTSLIAPTATDNCVGTIVGTHDATLPLSSQGLTVVTWTYDDGNGNVSSQTQNVFIDDATAPVADLASLSDITADCEVTSLTAPTATDNCAGTIIGTHNASLPITTLGTTVVTWTYNDGYGNSITQTQNVIITDIVAPVADLASLSDITADCQVASLTAPTATDNCAGAIIGTHNASLPITTQGTTVVTWTYDDGNGNTATQTQNVIIDDNTAPVPDAPVLVDIIADCQVTSLGGPSATDACVGIVGGIHDATLPITAQGTTIVTWTYFDGNGNSTTQTQNVIIDDITAPIADLAFLSDVTSDCEVTVLTAPTATDNCTGTITGTHNATLPISTPGTTVVTWTYDDGNGNSTTQTQNVIIDDLTAPVADLTALADITNDCEVTALTPPTATDNCAGVITGTHDATLPINSQGTTVVTWTYDDGNGNTTTQIQNVIITDITAPVADLASLSDITADCEVTSLTAPTATDNCSGAVVGTHNATLPITTEGTTVVTWTYDDGNGNAATQTQNIIIGIDVSVSHFETTIIANNSNATSYQWVDCANNYAVITGETNVGFTATQNGSYAVIITQGSCSDTSDCVTIDGVGLPSEVTNNAIKLYPNPANISVTIQGAVIGSEAVIRNLIGQEVKRFEIDKMNQIVDITDLSEGTYIVEIFSEGRSYSNRFVKLD